MNAKDYDVAVIGAGMAGLTAAMQAATDGASTIVLDRIGVGGQIASVEGITNFPDRREPVAGYDLGVELMDEAESAGAEVKLADVTHIEPAENGFRISFRGGEGLQARTVIIAGGSVRRSLGISEEEAFAGRGKSTCASCDGPFFRERRVVVVGGGDSALDEARILARFAREVLVVHDKPTLTASPAIVERAACHDNIYYRERSTVSAIQGEDRVQRVTMRDLETGVESDEAADAVFVYVGLDPNAAWLSGTLDLTETGHIAVDGALSTSRPGVFAAGDIREGSLAMLHESVDDGRRAALAALDHLSRTAIT